MTILVIGDSHSVIWEGSDVRIRAPKPKFEGVKVHHLNAPLAYNLISTNGAGLGKWGIETFRILEAEIASQGAPEYIMLSFGEIDIRTQIVARALSNRTSLNAETDAVASRLLKFAASLFDEFQIPILLWSAVPTPSASQDVWNPDFPCNGGELERNYCTKKMELTLEANATGLRAQGRSIYVFGAFDALTDGGRTNVNFQEDGCHLNWEGLKVGIQQLSQLCLAHGLTADRYFTAGHLTAGDLTYHKIELKPEPTISPDDMEASEIGWSSYDLGDGAVVDCIKLEFKEPLDLRGDHIHLRCGNLRTAFQPLPFRWTAGPESATLTLRIESTSTFRFLKIGVPNAAAEGLASVCAEARTFAVHSS